MHNMSRSQSMIIFIRSSLMPLSLMQEDFERPAQGSLSIFMYNLEQSFCNEALLDPWGPYRILVQTSWKNPHNDLSSDLCLQCRSLGDSLPIKDLLRSVKGYFIQECRSLKHLFWNLWQGLEDLERCVHVPEILQTFLAGL